MSTPFASLRVLVVDDDPVTVELTSTLLRQVGITTIASAADGGEAMAHISSGVDVVLCDLNMPGMDGVTFMEQLSTTAFTGALILMTGESAALLRTAEALAHLHTLRLLGTISKPVSATDLIELLRRSEPGGEETVLPTKPHVTPGALRAAMLADQLTVHYQPKVALTDGRILGLEALVRWNDPVLGVIPPDEFIGIAEDSGLIGALTQTVMEEVLADAPQILAAAGDITISINLSAKSLLDSGLPDQLARTVAGGPVPASRIIFEVTESRLLENLATALGVLSRLRMKGFRLSIDDFGTGYAGMRHLRDLPVDELKIDKSFVQAAVSDRVSRTIVEASAELGRKLELALVAEGIETREQWHMAADFGIDQAQGFLISRPLPVGELLDWVAGTADTDGHWPAPSRRSPVLDLQILRTVIGDDPARAARLHATLLGQSDTARPVIAAALAERDAHLIAETAHALKGAAWGIGATALGDACENLELAARRGALEDLPRLVHALEDDIEQFRTAAVGSQTG